MAKGKSSASSATRKKHARKAAAAAGEIEPQVPREKRPKGKEKGKKGKEVRKKVYIPPVKPAPVLPDPLDTLGIAQRISPELLVVLKRLSKKDSITKRRALEELQADWVDKVRVEEHRLHELVEAIPVWVRDVFYLTVLTLTYIGLSSTISLLCFCIHPVASEFLPLAYIRRYFSYRILCRNSCSFSCKTLRLLNNQNSSSGSGAWPLTTWTGS